MQQVAERLGAGEDECFFWATYSGSEIDLLWARGRRRWGFEIKRTSAPKFTPSMRMAIESLKLDRLFVVHAGDRTFPLHRRVTAVAAADLLAEFP